MTTYTYPEIRPSTQAWRLDGNTAIHRSPMNNSISTMDRDGEAWSIRMSYADIEGSRRRLLAAFLFKLNGAQHRMAIRDFGYVRAGVGGGTPLVNGADQTGKNLVIDGAPNSTNGWLLAGDKIGVAGLLHSVDADVDTDGSGNATIIVSPRIFIPPNTNDAVEIDAPTNSFALNIPFIEVVTQPPIISSLGFSAVSAL